MHGFDDRPAGTGAQRCAFRTRRAGAAANDAVDVARRQLGRAFALLAIGGASLPAARADAPVQTRSFAVGEFSGLRLTLGADYLLVPASRPSLEVSAEPAVLALIGAQLDGELLSVCARASFRTRQPLRVRIGYVRLERLALEGPSRLVASGLRGDRFALTTAGASELALEALDVSALSVEVRGSGSVRASGRCDEQRVAIDGSGSYDAQPLVCQRATIAAADAGEAVVTVRRSLDVSIRGAASVRYAGDPVVRRRIDGAGSLERL